ncbi:metallophosphoesterase family protein [Alkalibacillus haloalkaliphilus]|uniref:metallophosphoesterase family protein n=1 Tax=Alkalibacillus haloalkaliphilus TaxID=94136 RepID=UPI002935CD56|nr:metallophosphoesterase family protein [Alkalibacillus haloalkaliphilus]MDV2581504.1 metallophosphoesterase family protein [Alkalibacillus haloalkaliphilus]
MSYKIAVIADIHGNALALKEVLKQIDQSDKVQHIYCLGDLIGVGHQTNEVLDILFSRDYISFVRGNHDQDILSIIDGEKPNSKGEEREHHHWIASRLNPSFIPKLRNIPYTLRRQINGVQFLFLHYHMKKEPRFLPVNYDPTIDELEKLYDGEQSKVICFGHHHVVHHFKNDHQLFLNPGPLGCSHNPTAQYATITVGDKHNIDTSFFEVPYDPTELLHGYERLKVPAREFILNNFFGNQHNK